MKSNCRSLLIAGWALLLAATAATAAPGQPNQPTRKTKNGLCIPPESSEYTKVTDFIPFKTLADCIKSGGVVPADLLPKR